MNHRPVALPLIILAVVTTIAGAAPGDPIPGIGITVEQSPPSVMGFGPGGLPVIPGDFFGPGSEPFTGGLTLQGQCSYGCGGCDDDCSGDTDTGIAFLEGGVPHEYQAQLASFSLYSLDPIPVPTGGVDSFFDVIVRVSGQIGSPDAPLVGGMDLPAGEVLAPGTSSFMVDSFFDIAYRIEFRDHETGAPAGGVLEGTLLLDLQGGDQPVARLGADAGGAILPGFDGATAQPLLYAGTGLTVALRSVYESVVTNRTAGWSELKTLYR